MISHGNRLRTGLWAFAAALFLLPLVAMQFTDEVAWTAFDFLVFAMMLAGAGLVLEVSTRATNSRAGRAAVIVAVVTAFLLFWITGAVGIIGAESHPANRLYGGVLAIAVTGAVLARFRARGMMHTMLATGLAQLAVPLIAWTVGLGPAEPILQPEVVILTLVFAGLWFLAAGLFRAQKSPHFGGLFRK